MKIAVIDEYQDAFRDLACAARLQGHELMVYRDTVKDAAKFAARLEGCEAVIMTQQRSPLPKTLVDQLPASVKLLCNTGRNVGHIDVAACTARGIIVAAAGGGLPNATAELTWGLILASLRSIPQEVEQLKQGVWQTTVGTGAHGKTLGIYALGKIGSVTAQVGKAFGMKVTCWGRDASKAKAKALGYEVPGSREAFFAGADVICLHIPLNKETRGIVTAADLAQMKPTALIVNTSRAGLIAEGALVEALKKGRPGFGAIDVYEEEPVVGGHHPLLKMPNVVCTPHLGYVERGTYESYYGTVVDSILGYAAGKPVNVLNPEVLK
jgi:D-3-phosphoglycerate dehydrogenase / 2-oxoglutarate reductase